ncbi:MAG TPA: serine hydrolase domain-containing protein [Bacilli bacterium]|nr:serine hydrolase domain-containing protein [Bacilli bacterium]
MRRAILQGLDNEVYAGAVVCVARNGDPMFFEAHGLAEMSPNERPMSIDTRFDLGSLTQVTATLPAVLRTIQLGKLSLLDPIARYLPEFATGADRHAKGKITVFQLLTHTAGLPSWRPLFLQARGVKAYLRALADLPLEAQPGERVVASDFGFLLLGFALERIWDRELPEVCERLVFTPLEMNQTAFATGGGLPEEICAALEIGDESERKRCAPFGEKGSFPWRPHLICGEVLDGNAYYGLDGVGGQAGLFSTAGDLTRFAEMWLRKGVFQRERYLDSMLVALATHAHTTDAGRERGFGWELATHACTLGDSVPTMSYGLVANTGAALWLDPLSKVSAVVLTNHLHPQIRDGLPRWRAGFFQKVFLR